MPCSAAQARPAASARFERTNAISAGKSGARLASTSACMFEPRPEISTAIRLCRPRHVAELQLAAKMHCRRAVLGNDLPDHAGRLRRQLRGRENLLLARLGSAMTTMPMPQLNVRVISVVSMPCRCLQPAEHARAPASCRDRCVHGEAVGQNARDVFEQPAAGDVRQRLDRAGLADGGEQRLHVDAGRRQQARRQGWTGRRTAPASSQPRPRFSTTRRTSE